MTERNPLLDQIRDLEDDIIDLNSGLDALGTIAQNAVDRDPSRDLSGLFFVERGLKAVHKSLQAKFEALHGAAIAAGGEDPADPRPEDNGGES